MFSLLSLKPYGLPCVLGLGQCRNGLLFLSPGLARREERGSCCSPRIWLSA